MRKIFYMNTSYDEKIDVLKDITFEFRPNITSEINCNLELLSNNENTVENIARITFIVKGEAVTQILVNKYI